MPARLGVGGCAYLRALHTAALARCGALALAWAVVQDAANVAQRVFVILLFCATGCAYVRLHAYVRPPDSGAPQSRRRFHMRRTWRAGASSPLSHARWTTRMRPRRRACRGSWTMGTTADCSVSDTFTVSHTSPTSTLPVVSCDLPLPVLNLGRLTRPGLD